MHVAVIGRKHPVIFWPLSFFLIYFAASVANEQPRKLKVDISNVINWTCTKLIFALNSKA